MNQIDQEKNTAAIKSKIIAIVVLAVLTAWIGVAKINIAQDQKDNGVTVGIKGQALDIIGSVLAGNAYELRNSSGNQMVWKNMAADLIENGTIDGERFFQLYKNRGIALDQSIFQKESTTPIVFSIKNSSESLNTLWAFGLAQESPILLQGPMMNPQYAGADHFASTGGWTLAQGPAMNHYAKHRMLNLTPEQEKQVLRIAQNIYRPCCDNPTHFPDCNHGMAMLGLLEVIAASADSRLRGTEGDPIAKTGVTDEQMYDAALAANVSWFPDNYATIGMYLQNHPQEAAQLTSKDILGAPFSSATGFAQIARQVQNKPQGGSSCGA